MSSMPPILRVLQPGEAKPAPYVIAAEIDEYETLLAAQSAVDPDAPPGPEALGARMRADQDQARRRLQVLYRKLFPERQR